MNKPAGYGYPIWEHSVIARVIVLSETYGLPIQARLKIEPPAAHVD